MSSAAIGSVGLGAWNLAEQHVTRVRAMGPNPRAESGWFARVKAAVSDEVKMDEVLFVDGLKDGVHKGGEKVRQIAHSYPVQEAKKTLKDFGHKLKEISTQDAREIGLDQQPEDEDDWARYCSTLPGRVVAWGLLTAARGVYSGFKSVKEYKDHVAKHHAEIEYEKVAANTPDLVKMFPLAFVGLRDALHSGFDLASMAGGYAGLMGIAADAVTGAAAAGALGTAGAASPALTAAIGNSVFWTSTQLELSAAALVLETSEATVDTYLASTSYGSKEEAVDKWAEVNKDALGLAFTAMSTAFAQRGLLKAKSADTATRLEAVKSLAGIDEAQKVTKPGLIGQIQKVWQWGVDIYNRISRFSEPFLKAKEIAENSWEILENFVDLEGGDLKEGLTRVLKWGYRKGTKTHALPPRIPAVGFEFETPWRVGTLNTTNDGLVKIPKASKLIVSSDGWEMQSDETTTGEADIEFVTDPFDETPSGRKKLAKAMSQIERLTSWLISRNGSVPFVRVGDIRGHGSVGAAFADVRIRPDSEMKGNPQVSAAIRLDMLPRLFAKLGKTETETVDSRTRTAITRAYLFDSTRLNAFKFGMAPDNARLALANLQATGALPATAGGLPFGSDSLIGLLSMTSHYLVRASEDIKNYLKSMTLLMARTDFAGMFDILPTHERDYFRGGHAAEFAQLALDSAGLAGTGAQPVFSGVIADIQGHTDPTDAANFSGALKAVSRERWLKSIVEGDTTAGGNIPMDLLTKRNFPDANVASDFESMGGLVDGGGVPIYGTVGRTPVTGIKKLFNEVTGTGQLAPVFEFRKIPTNMQSATWRGFSLDSFDFFYKINLGLDTDFTAAEISKADGSPEPEIDAVSAHKALGNDITDWNKYRLTLGLPPVTAPGLPKMTSGGSPGAASVGLSASGGQPLAPDLRQRMESMFRTDFSAVRIHVDSGPSEIGAAAYAQGASIHFAPGRFATDTPAGIGLLGHELTHVVQHGQGRVPGGSGLSAPIIINSALEAEADAFGNQAARQSSPTQRKPIGGAGIEPGALRQSLLASSTGNAPDLDLRRRIEDAMGFDPGIVRLHTGAAASTAAADLNAQAFTIGRDVFFGAGKFNPNTSSGMGLIAHELTHVSQQTRGDSRLGSSSGFREMEREAEVMEAMVQNGRLEKSVDIVSVDIDIQNGSPDSEARIQAIALLALKKVREMPSMVGLSSVDLDEVELDIELDLNLLTDESAATLWAAEIAKQIRSEAGLAQAYEMQTQSASQSGLLRVQTKPRLQRSPQDLNPSPDPSVDSSPLTDSEYMAWADVLKLPAQCGAASKEELMDAYNWLAVNRGTYLLSRITTDLHTPLTVAKAKIPLVNVWAKVEPQLLEPKAAKQLPSWMPADLFDPLFVSKLQTLTEPERTALADSVYKALVLDVSGATLEQDNSEFDLLSTRVQKGIEGEPNSGRANFIQLRLPLLDKFGGHDDPFTAIQNVNLYYGSLVISSFLGHTGPPVHATLQTALNAAETRLKTENAYDSVKAAIKGYGGLQIRKNANAPSLSEHSFGFAIDIDATVNPNYNLNTKGGKDALNADMVQEFTGVDILEGGDVKVLRAANKDGGNYQASLAAAQHMRDASDAYKTVFESEQNLSAALEAYLTRQGVKPTATQMTSWFALGDAASSAKVKRGAVNANLAQLADEFTLQMKGSTLTDPVGSPTALLADKYDPKATSSKQLDKDWPKIETGLQTDLSETKVEDRPAIVAGVRSRLEQMIQIRARAAASADFVTRAVGIYRSSFVQKKDRKTGAVTTERVKKSTTGDRAATAAYGFMNLPPQLIAALVESGLVWLGSTPTIKDFMHFELRSPRPPLVLPKDSAKEPGNAK